MNMKRVGVDLAKQALQAHGADTHEPVACRRHAQTCACAGFFRQLTPYVVSMEACGSAHHLGSRSAQAGAWGVLDLPQFVKLYGPLALEGAGSISATVLVAVVGDAWQFRTARQIATWLGRVSRQHSSGGQQRPGKISKRDDT